MLFVFFQYNFIIYSMQTSFYNVTKRSFMSFYKGKAPVNLVSDLYASTTQCPLSHHQLLLHT